MTWTSAFKRRSLVWLSCLFCLFTRHFLFWLGPRRPSVRPLARLYCLFCLFMHSEPLEGSDTLDVLLDKNDSVHIRTFILDFSTDSSVLMLYFESILVQDRHVDMSIRSSSKSSRPTGFQHPFVGLFYIGIRYSYVFGYAILLLMLFLTVFSFFFPVP